MKKFLILDGSGYLFRAYYGLPDMINSDGMNVNAVYGFIRMIFKLFHEKPDYFVIAWDSPKKTIRHEKFKEYKANRPKIPDDFKNQIGLVKTLIDELGIPFFEKPGYEADDIIHSLVNFRVCDDCQYRVISADKDLKQMLSDGVVFYDPLKQVEITTESFVEEHGFEPKSIVDYLALVGDASDNVPGVKGIGKKGAETLIQKYGNLDKIYENIDEITGSTKDKLIDGKEDAYNSKDLIELYDVDEINFTSSDTYKVNLNFDKIKDILINKHNFKSLEKGVNELKQVYTMGQQESLFGF